MFRHPVMIPVIGRSLGVAGGDYSNTTMETPVSGGCACQEAALEDALGGDLITKLRGRAVSGKGLMEA